MHWKISSPSGIDRPMKTHTLFFTLIFSLPLLAQAAKRPSTSPLPMANSHIVDSGNGHPLYRGAAPKARDISSFQKFGIERVLIFKNDTKGEVAQEIEWLKASGVQRDNILHIPMPWKENLSFLKSCQLTLKALRFLEASKASRKSTYFHCTMGEDRTGYLAGLWKLWSGHERSITRTFKAELCQKGYAHGNPQKPLTVANTVQEILTPQFLKMVELLKQSRLKGKSLDEITCPQDMNINWELENFHCQNTEL